MHYVKGVINKCIGKLFAHGIFLLLLTTLTVEPLVAQKPVKLRSTLSMGAPSTIHGVTVQQSIGQSGVINSYSADRYLLRQGYLQPLHLSDDRKVNKKKKLQAKIYPNPFSSGINISFFDQISGNLNFILYNAHGKIVYSKNHPATQDLYLDLELLNSGMYFINISSNNLQLTQKLIKR